MTNLDRLSMQKELMLDDEMFRGVIDIPLRPGQRPNRYWGPKSCEDFALAKKIPDSLRTADSQRAVVKRFMAFYETGHTPDTHTARDIILAMAHMIQEDDASTAEQLIWKKEFYSSDSKDSAFSLEGEAFIVDEETSGEQSTSPVDALNSFLKGAIIKDLHIERDIKLSDDAAIASRIAREQAAMVRPEEELHKITRLVIPSLTNIKEGSLKTFMAGCYDVLVHSPSSTELTRSELGVFKLFNFLALVMIGAVAKSESKLTHFLKHELRKDIAILINTPQAHKYAPPCSECIKQVSTSIVKNTPVVSSFIAKCVDYYWVSAEIPTNVTAIMGATFLADTEWKGMGILSMIVEITGHYYLPWKTLVKLTANNKNLQTWKTVVNFMRQYQNIDNEDKTVRWARMLDDAYFSELSIKRNHLLASLLAETLITIQGHRGLYNAKWARQYQKTLEEYRRASEYLRDMIIKLSSENYYI